MSVIARKVKDSKEFILWKYPNKQIKKIVVPHLTPGTGSYWFKTKVKLGGEDKKLQYTLKVIFTGKAHVKKKALPLTVQK